jgi:hypothetical protein
MMVCSRGDREFVVVLLLCHISGFALQTEAFHCAREKRRPPGGDMRQKNKNAAHGAAS